MAHLALFKVCKHSVRYNAVEEYEMVGELKMRKKVPVVSVYVMKDYLENVLEVDGDNPPTTLNIEVSLIQE